MFRYLSIVIGIVQGLVMVPLYLHFIPLNIYSIWLATGNILAWMSVSDPGLTIVLQQQVADAYGKRDFTKVVSLIGGGLLLCVIVLAIAIIFGLIAAYYLPDLLNITSMQDSELILKAFTLAILGTALMIFSFGISAINQGLQGSIVVGIINNSVAILSIIVTFILLHYGFSVMALAISLVFSGVGYSLFQGIYLFIRVYNEKIDVSFSYKGMKALGKLLSYTFISRTLSIFANNVDLIVVSRLLGAESVAILALTRKSCDMSRELINQPSIAFQPAVSHAKGAGDEKKLTEVLTRLTHILIWMLFLVVGGLICFNESFVHLGVGSEFFAGNTINLFICISLIFIMTYNCLSQLCFALGDVKGTSVVMAIQSLLFIPIVIVGTKYFGLLGAVLAHIFSSLMVSIWYFPRTFARLLRLSRQDIKNIIYQVFICILTILLINYVFSFFTPKNWIGFFSFVLVYCLSYGLILLSSSESFRIETKFFWKKLLLFQK